MRYNPIMRSAFRIFTALVIGIFSISSSGAFSPGMLKITTSDDTGRPLSGVGITIASCDVDSIELFHSKTELKGTLFIPSFPNGVYRVRADRPGFSPARSTCFRVRYNTLIEIVLEMVLEDPGPGPSAEDMTAITEKPYPSITRLISLDRLKGRASASIPLLMSELPDILISKDREVILTGSRSSDIRYVLDGLPLFSPVNRGHFMSPPPLFLGELKLVEAGVSGFSESSLAGVLEMSSLGNEPRDFDHVLGGSFNLANSSFLTDRESASQFDYWNEQTGTVFEQPKTDPRIASNEGHLLSNFKIDNTSILLAGTYIESDALPESDFAGDSAYELSNLWLKATQAETSVGDFRFLAAFQEEWVRPDNLFRLRGYNPIYDHSEKRMFVLGWQTELPGKIKFGISADYMNAEIESGPGTSRNSIETDPGKIGSDSGDEYPDFPFVRVGDYSVIRLQSYGSLISPVHAVDAGLTYQYLKLRWSEGYFPSLDPYASESDDILWGMDTGDWEFSLWGRDRWFATDSLEISIIMRWDRYHYLENPDHISTRLMVGYSIPQTRFFGGIERLIIPPGLAYLESQTSWDDSDYPRVSEAQTGLRWFAGAHHKIHDSFTMELSSYYAFISNPVIAVPIRRTEHLVFYESVSGQRVERTGIMFQGRYKPVAWFDVSLDYKYTDGKYPWPGDLPEGRLVPQFQNRYAVTPCGDISGDPVPVDYNIEHAVALAGSIRIGILWNTMFGFNCKYASGIPYTQVENSEEPFDRCHASDTVNARIGDSWTRIDLNLSKTFSIFRGMSLQTRLNMMNVLNTLNGSPVDPYTGNDYVEPYATRGNLPRTISVELDFFI